MYAAALATEHGIDITFHSTEDAARWAIAAFVREWWEDAERWMDEDSDTSMPDDRDEAIRRYFNFAPHDFYEIVKVPS